MPVAVSADHLQILTVPQLHNLCDRLGLRQLAHSLKEVLVDTLCCARVTYDDLTVEDLKYILKSEGLRVTGVKADLIRRLCGAADGGDDENDSCGFSYSDADSDHYDDQPQGSYYHRHSDGPANKRRRMLDSTAAVVEGRQTPLVGGKGVPTPALTMSTWSWADDHGRWVGYGPHESWLLSQARDRGETRLTLQVGGRAYSVDLRMMVQRNPETGRQRRIRHASGGPGSTGSGAPSSQYSAYPSSSSSSSNSPLQSGAHPPSAWSFRDDHGRWVPYSDSDARVLSQAEARGDASVGLRVGGQSYVVDLVTRVQRNLSTNRVREIHRVQNQSQPRKNERFCSHREGDGEFGTKIGANFLEIVGTALPKDKSVWCRMVSKGLLDFATKNGEDKNVAQQVSSLQLRDLSRDLYRLYTASTWVYRRVNEALRKDSKDDLLLLGPYIAAMLALGGELALPPAPGIGASGGVVTLYRGVKLTAAQLAQYQAGKGFVWKGFTSTTLDPTVAQSFGDTRFVIQVPHLLAKYAVDVHELSRFPEEREVLLPPNINFQVVKVTHDPRTCTEISVKASTYTAVA